MHNLPLVMSYQTATKVKITAYDNQTSKNKKTEASTGINFDVRVSHETVSKGNKKIIPDI